MTHGSLESGLGGFDYASEQAGFENVFHCEINPFCQTILNYYWPQAKSYADIFEFDASEWRGKVDIISCGFPCQPFSVAGAYGNAIYWPVAYEIFKAIKETDNLF